jgi:hypothetical protein
LFAVKKEIENILLDEKVDLDMYPTRNPTGSQRQTPLAYLLREKRRLEVTLDSIRYKEVRSNLRRATTEAEEVSNTDVSPAAVVQTENFFDVSGVSPHEEKVGVTFSDSDGLMSEFKLENFTDRWMEVSSGTLTLGSNTFLEIPIWDVLSRNPAWVAKIRNGGFYKASIEVNFAFSGNSFHKGLVLLAYVPWPVMNDALNAVSVRDNGLFSSYLSQTQSSMILNVRDNQVVHMDIPYIQPKPRMRLFNDSALVIADSDSLNDFYRAGSIYVRTLTTPGAVNATSDPIPYRILGRFKNVEWGVPTGTHMQVTTESDERKTGPVEKMSSAAAAALQKITTVPIVGPYAKASSIALSSLSDISALFGWSKPILSAPTERVRNEPLVNGARGIGDDLSKAITLDPEHELYVDPRVCGTMSDDMALSAIYTRPSLTDLNRTWSPSDAPLSTILYRTRVAPQHDFIHTVGTSEYHQPSALSFVATPFKFWRGDIDYTFHFAASAFHKGKVAFFYDPNIDQYALITADLSTNKNPIAVLDLEQSNSITIRIGWQFHRAFAKTLPLDEVKYNGNGQFDPTISARDYVNGFLIMVPYNGLVSPDGAELEFVVSVSSPEMHFAFPTEEHLPLDRTAPESNSGWYYGKEVTIFDINKSKSDATHIFGEYFGESVVSFRTLAKRFQPFREGTFSHLAADNRCIHTTVPIFHLHTPAMGSVSVREDLSILGYLLPAYLGFRGSMRHRYHVFSEHDVVDTNRINVTLDNTLTYDPAMSSTGDTSPARTSLRGTVSFVPTTNAGISYELPFITNNLFLFACSDGYGIPLGDPPLLPDLGVMESEWVRSYTVDHELLGAQSSVRKIVIDAAMGEDATLMRFIAAPLYRVAL